MFDEASSDEEKLVWEEWRPANVEPPPAHYHPATDERFVGLDGRLIVEIEGEETQLEADTEIVVPSETPHRSFTRAESAQFKREVTPPGRWGDALTARFAAAHAIEEVSTPRKFLQTVLLLRAYPDVVVPARPARPVQRVVFPVLGAVARAIGLKATYPYPRNATDEDE